MQYIIKLIEANTEADNIIASAIERGISLTKLLPSASYWGHTELVKSLLEAGVDPMTEGRSGAPSVVYALQWGHAPTVREFLKVLPGTVIVEAPWVTSFTHWPLGQQPHEIPMIGNINILLQRVCRQRGEY